MSQHRTPPTSDFILHVTDHCLLSGYVVDNLSTPLAAQDGQKLRLWVTLRPPRTGAQNGEHAAVLYMRQMPSKAPLTARRSRLG